MKDLRATKNSLNFELYNEYFTTFVSGNKEEIKQAGYMYEASIPFKIVDYNFLDNVLKIVGNDKGTKTTYQELIDYMYGRATKISNLETSIVIQIFTNKTYSLSYTIRIVYNNENCENEAYIIPVSREDYDMITTQVINSYNRFRDKKCTSIKDIFFVETNREYNIVEIMLYDCKGMEVIDFKGEKDTLDMNYRFFLPAIKNKIKTLNKKEDYITLLFTGKEALLYDTNLEQEEAQLLLNKIILENVLKGEK